MTNQFTDEQVEAAAQAINEYEQECSRKMVAESKRIWGHGGAFIADHAITNLGRARAALEAAAGVAPQAECNCGAGPGSAVCKKVCATRAPGAVVSESSEFCALDAFCIRRFEHEGNCVEIGHSSY